ncbi:MAG: DUF4249 family protein, partial [Paludibacter sp.]
KSPIYFLFFAVLTSCANSVIEDAPWNNTPVPVVFSILSPNEPVQVYLYRTYNKDIPAVKNPYPEAKVYICGSDSVWVELTRLSPDTTMFEDSQKKLAIEMGKTYSLKIELSDRTVHAQTTVIPESAHITDVSCVFSGKIQEGLVMDSLPKFVFDSVYINNLTVKFSQPANSEYGIGFFVSSRPVYGNMLPDEGKFVTDYLETPKDSTSFILKMTTIDPLFNKYKNALDINSVTTAYSYNSPVQALIQSFGGVLPQFSNIVNGVGLFGSSVTESTRVVIKTPNPYPDSYRGGNYKMR